MQDYSKLVEALRCKRDDCEGCGLAFLDNDEGWICQYAAKDDDAADAIEALQAEVEILKVSGREAYFEGLSAGDNGRQVEELAKRNAKLHAELQKWVSAAEQAGEPKRGEWELIDGAEPMRWGCSRCKYMSWETSNYCPRCGAKMEVQDG